MLEKGLSLADELGIESFFGTSAKLDQNVKQSFETLIEKVFNRLYDGKFPLQQPPTNSEKGGGKKLPNLQRIELNGFRGEFFSCFLVILVSG